MKKSPVLSFRARLFAAFLLASLVPLLICSAMLLQIFRLRMTDAAETEARAHLNSALHVLDEAHGGFVRAADALRGDPLVVSALAGRVGTDAQVYARLFDATASARDCARFDLYDAQGNWRYSTRNAPAVRALPVDWGPLHHAREGAGLVFTACEDPMDSGAPLLQGAAALSAADRTPAGSPPFRPFWG